MLYQLHKFNRSTHFILACSGGVDSMAIADFYKRGGKKFTLAYFNHATPLAGAMQDFTSAWALVNGVPYETSTISVERGKRQSKEEFWRDQRYSWLRSFNKPIVTCHHLNDAVEGYIFSALNGNPKIIKHYNDNVYRPFLTNTKQDLINWCVNHNVSWLEDSSNKDVAYPRNRIRHNIIPEAMMINPGLAKVIKRKILNKFIENTSEAVQLASIKQNGYATLSISNPSEEFQIAAVNQDWEAIQYIENPSEAVQFAAVKKNSLVIRFIQNPSEAIQLSAIKKNSCAILYIKNPSEEVQLEAVKKNGYVIQWIKSPSKAVQLAAVKQNSLAIKYIQNPCERIKKLAFFI